MYKEWKHFYIMTGLKEGLGFGFEFTVGKWFAYVSIRAFKWVLDAQWDREA